MSKMEKTKMSKSEIKKYAGIYDDLADLLGEEAVELIFKTMSGQQITLPRKLFTQEYVIQQTKGITDQKELKKVAVRYGYSERRLKQLLKQDKMGEM